MRAPWILLLVACGGDPPIDRLVGARCTRDADCEHRCLTGNAWPGGFCSLSCDDNADCPADTVCIGDESGVCAFTCEVDAHCDFLEDRFRCEERDFETGGKVRVCRGS